MSTPDAALDVRLPKVRCIQDRLTRPPELVHPVDDELAGGGGS
jgi:hypothetical protein